MIAKIMKRFFLLVIGLVKYVPFPAAMTIRGVCYRRVMKRMGRGTNIADGVTITNPPKVSLGSGVSIHEYSYLGTMGEIVIGDNVAIGSHCAIISNEHRFDRQDIPIKRQGWTARTVTIGDDVWFGCRVTVLPGVTIGRGAVIGAGAVVTDDIPPSAVAAGVPARVMRYR